VDRVRRIASLDLDLDGPVEQLSRDPLIGPLLGIRPGLRPPGTWDPFETGVRAIVGQQVSIAGATTITGRLVERFGAPVPGLGSMGLTHTFPSPEDLADADLSGIGLTRSRQDAITGFAAHVAKGAVRLDRSVGLDELVASMTAIPGVGPWTAHYLALRLGEPDAFPASDLGVRRALSRAASRSGAADGQRGHAVGIDASWRPWRALATTHLWFSGEVVNATGERQSVKSVGLACASPI
jgi:3-methyladenine DNA glycosylase/8-oxoguanine DNA glycosylase